MHEETLFGHRGGEGGDCTWTDFGIVYRGTAGVLTDLGKTTWWGSSGIFLPLLSFQFSAKESRKLERIKTVAPLHRPR